MSNQITKNQHYVPQFLICGFSTNSKVNIFDIERNEFRKNQSIQGCLSQNYFYDKDNSIENFLADKIEGPAARLINEIRSLNFNKLNNGETELIKFICCQQKRTPAGREDFISLINEHFFRWLSALNDLNDLQLAPEALRGFRVAPENRIGMMNLNATQAMTGIVLSKGMEDLRFHILINKTGKNFFLSDHPVSRYNWFYKDLNDPSIGSPFIKGVQLFLPVSEKICICAYDTTVYKYGSRSKDISYLTQDIDVDWINKLQMRGTGSVIVFKSASEINYLLDLHKKFHGRKIYSNESLVFNYQDIGSNEQKMTYATYTRQININTKPGFFKQIKKQSLNVEERIPDTSKCIELILSNANPPEEQSLS